MARSQYIDVPIETDPQVLQRVSFDYLMDKFPGWVPNDGDLETIFVEAISLQVAELRDVASAVPEAIFRRFGQIVGVFPLEASASAANTTWTMKDAAGYTIKAGTQVGVRTAGDVLIPFRVANDVVIPPGNAGTISGQVLIIAFDAGARSSDIGTVAGPVELIDSLDYVNSIILVGPTAGGVDAELDSDYLNRLARQMSIIAPRPILPGDVALMATNIVGVGRALVLDGYNPDDQTYNNERYATVAVVDAAGEALSSGKKSEVDAYLQARREVNFIFRVIDPTYTTIDVTFGLKAYSNYDPVEVRLRAITAISNYLSPSNWGQKQYSVNLPEWFRYDIVRYNELVETLGKVEGIDYTLTGSAGLTIGINGGAQDVSDKTLAGAAPLPRAGSITGTVT